MEEIVWGAGDQADVSAKSMGVCKEHVCPILSPGPVLRELEEWAREQSKKHHETGKKIWCIHRNTPGAYHTGVSALATHHYTISNNYSDVARGIRAVIYKI